MFPRSELSGEPVVCYDLKIVGIDASISSFLDDLESSTERLNGSSFESDWPACLC